MIYLTADSHVDNVTGEVIYNIYNLEDSEYMARRYLTTYPNTDFVWLTPHFVEKCQNDPPIQLARLLYLATYVNYRQELISKDRQRMRKKDVKSVLDLKDSSFTDFWQWATAANYLIEGDTGIILAQTCMYRGKLSGKYFIRPEISRRSFRMFSATIRQLYEMKPEISRQFIGYYIKLLYWTNSQTNIICKNPEEKDVEKIQCSKISEAAGLLGLDKSHAARWYKNMATPILYTTRYASSFTSLNTLSRQEKRPVKQDVVNLTLITFRHIKINGALQDAIFLNPNLCYSDKYLDLVREVGCFERRIVNDATETRQMIKGWQNDDIILDELPESMGDSPDMEIFRNAASQASYDNFNYEEV